MKRTKPYRSPVMASIHETAEDLYSAALMNKVTMRKFDAMCLTPIPRLKPRQIRKLRLREGASQAVFARLPERDHRPRQPMGTRRKIPARNFSQASRSGRQERTPSGRIVVEFDPTATALLFPPFRATRKLEGVERGR
jgi:hypothetical protein